VSNVLALTRANADEIIAHARDHAPRECCGIITGAGGEATHVRRLTNTEPGNTRYLFDDEEFFRVYWEAQAAGEDLTVVYHSHPATPAWPSPTDQAHATWPDAIYLICSLADPDSPVLRAFRLVDGTITEVDVTII
jgi:proteasome lid subunit RPN8/RPN11